jgi:hypothetical protein
MMRESQYIKSWERVGEERGLLLSKREYLLTAVQELLQNPVPESIRLAIEGTNDLVKLQTWYLATLRAETIADLRKEMRLDP